MLPLDPTQTSDDSEAVALTLMGGRVTRGFRAALFAHASRLGVSVNEYVLLAVAEKLHVAGLDFPGIFNPGDFANLPRNEHEG